LEKQGDFSKIRAKSHFELFKMLVPGSLMFSLWGDGASQLETVTYNEYREAKTKKTKKMKTGRRRDAWM